MYTGGVHDDVTEHRVLDLFKGPRSDTLRGRGENFNGFCKYYKLQSD